MPRTRPGKPAPPPPDVMTIDDLAAYIQVSKSSIYKLAQEGCVPDQNVGEHWRFHKATIDGCLQAGSSGRPSKK